ncbi:hypothetical protein L365_02701 [Klebsiella pneumoniae MGH 19]|nr:hypothetical protein L365_02701 [Klebsiella pneumoniae MGH 19]
MAISVQRAPKHFPIWKAKLNVVDRVPKEGIADTFGKQNQHCLCYSSYRKMNRSLCNAMNYIKNHPPTLALSRSGGTGISQPSQRRAPRVKIVKLLSVVEFTATHRFIQQAFSPGYDTIAAIMLIRRPGGIAFRCWRAENNDIMRYLAYRGYTPWPFITMRWY